MKVWICDNREYSSGGNQAVFSSKEVAQKVCNAFHWNDPEQYELDPEMPEEAFKGKRYWNVIFYFDKDLKQTSFGVWVEEDKDSTNAQWFKSHDETKRFIVNVWAEDRETAVKIGADIMAQHPYREEEE